MPISHPPLPEEGEEKGEGAILPISKSPCLRVTLRPVTLSPGLSLSLSCPIDTNQDMSTITGYKTVEGDRSV